MAAPWNSKPAHKTADRARIEEAETVSLRLARARAKNGCASKRPVAYKSIAWTMTWRCSKRGCCRVHLRFDSSTVVDVWGVSRRRLG